MVVIHQSTIQKCVPYRPSTLFRYNWIDLIVNLKLEDEGEGKWIRIRWLNSHFPHIFFFFLKKKWFSGIIWFFYLFQWSCFNFLICGYWMAIITGQSLVLDYLCVITMRGLCEPWWWWDRSGRYHFNFFLIFCQGKLHLKLTVFFFLLLLVVVDYYHLPLFYPHPTWSKLPFGVHVRV